MTWSVPLIIGWVMDNARNVHLGISVTAEMLVRAQIALPLHSTEPYLEKGAMEVRGRPVKSACMYQRCQHIHLIVCVMFALRDLRLKTRTSYLKVAKS